MRLRSLSSIIALHAFVALTACGGGGGASDPTQHVDPPPPQPPTPKDPQGFWHGTTTNGRVVSGVVTKENDYWFAYTPDANSQTIIGFYTGRGLATSTTPPNGTFTSSNLRDVNFNAGATLVGAISVPAGAATNYSARNTLSGSLDPVNVGTSTYTVSGAFTVTANINGSLVSVPLTINSGSYDSTAGTGSWNVSADLMSGVGLPNIIWDQTFTLNAATGLGNLNAATGCHPAGIACSGIGPQFVGPITNAAGAVVAGVQSWTVSMPNFGDAVFAPTLAQNLLPSITADAFNLQYGSVYEETPAMATLAGHYSGTAGIGTAQSSAGATFDIDDATGTITGDAAMSGDACHYQGTAKVHPTGGNVYDVTLTVSNCIEASGDFAGVAILDSSTNKVTVMTITTAAARDTGVMFVGTK